LRALGFSFDVADEHGKRPIDHAREAGRTALLPLCM
jgi:hypothetical protein